jgi:hypothetical protein
MRLQPRLLRAAAWCVAGAWGGRTKMMPSTSEPTAVAMRKPSASMAKMSTSGSSLSSSAMLTLILSTRTDRRAPTTPSARRRRSLVISTMPAACYAIAGPGTPMAIPTSAAASAGPSLTPSPTMATGASFLSSLIAASFSCGVMPA